MGNTNSQKLKKPKIDTHCKKITISPPADSNDNSKISTEESEFIDPRSPSGKYFSRTPIANNNAEFASFLQMSNDEDEILDPRSPAPFARTPVTKLGVEIDFSENTPKQEIIHFNSPQQDSFSQEITEVIHMKFSNQNVILGAPIIHHTPNSKHSTEDSQTSPILSGVISEDSPQKTPENKNSGIQRDFSNPEVL